MAMVAVPQVVMQRSLTLADYEALPDDADYEIIDGVLYVSPRALARHQVIANRLSTDLTIHVRATGTGEVVPDADLIVDERKTYISPDIMYFAGDRYAQVNPDEMLRIVPDLVVEVLSPSTNRYDLVTKHHLYEQLGVPHYWILDARANTVHECVLGTDRSYTERVVTKNEPFEPVLFTGLTIDLHRVFA